MEGQRWQKISHVGKTGGVLEEMTKYKIGRSRFGKLRIDKEIDFVICYAVDTGKRIAEYVM